MFNISALPQYPTIEQAQDAAGQYFSDTYNLSGQAKAAAAQIHPVTEFISTDNPSFIFACIISPMRD